MRKFPRQCLNLESVPDNWPNCLCEPLESGIPSRIPYYTLLATESNAPPTWVGLRVYAPL